MRFSRSSIALSVAFVVILAAALVPASPILNAETGAAVTDASLVHPAAYTLLAPLCTLLDALTLLSLRQHAALLATVVLCVIVWRILRARREGTSPLREIGAACATLIGILVVYAVGALIPRPMAAIRMHDRNDVVIDFHSHTDASWDARKWFTPARNRAWHAASGFDVAYVSDHKSLAGAIAATRQNPPRAGDGTVLLPALEARDHYQHVIAIGIDSTFRFDPKGDWHDPVLDASGVMHATGANTVAPDTATSVTAAPPLLILTIPGNLTMIPENELHGFARLYAVELSDAAPKGVGMIQQQRANILRYADTLNLAVVAGSDNHGWGSTASGWSIMRIPGWRRMRPAELDTAIQRGIRIERRRAVRVYVRDSPNPGTSAFAAAFTAPLVIWRVLVDLDWPERISWLGWITLIASIAAMLSSRAARDTMPPAVRRKPAKV